MLIHTTIGTKINLTKTGYYMDCDTETITTTGGMLICIQMPIKATLTNALRVVYSTTMDILMILQIGKLIKYVLSWSFNTGN